MKTLTKAQQKKNQQQNSKQHQKLNQVKPKGKASASKPVELEEAEELSAYDSYYKQLAEETETIERHVRELRQTPGLEHLTEAEAQAQVDFMLRYSAWVFNQHQQEPQIAFTTDDEIEATSAKVSKVQKLKGQSNKKVTKFLPL
ncbi:hypothetical protein H7F15_05610 [Pontibacter sp. Tf4]|uniref:hypothetical protein n=1 Tax=Pontibacter sp. Tf4 TaxID=2761620 RepID=UPI00162915EE|nr:hypothetical protein [Pontibacter sp. Tf4]MBB6610504.1 hypothetical protein [Pontibacter sp. Tf4]